MKTIHKVKNRHNVPSPYDPSGRNDSRDYNRPDLNKINKQKHTPKK